MKRAPRQNAVAAVVVVAGEIAEIVAAGAAVAAGGAIVTSNKFHIQLLTGPCPLSFGAADAMACCNCGQLET